MTEIVNVLYKIIRIMQVFIVLGSAISFIYLGYMTYIKKIDEVKKNLPWILLGLALLFASYSIPALILSFLEVKKISP
ncbi:MAG: hypothetical protein ACO2O4_02175 [Minisyncoccia bacterium]|jgi:hypothetical protein